MNIKNPQTNKTEEKEQKQMKTLNNSNLEQISNLKLFLLSEFLKKLLFM